ncbi:hypothetical protein [Shewanella algae]|uniref:HEAT repeat domain-containing protein n=1 Tax=Shewanella algae TaxID=38313 RepID=A0A380BEN8_9GAMM|nr:hypothetical protein [Shewanella algae]MBO2557597.1 hypothetical protein [Shewanella algae]MBO2574533.1 hypothetical protein [Shewanella algae]MBO2608557.1 hypothetical protein [Shewanella algae]SUJ00120.1 Uncharacterised protein [Shewanella algae]
MRTIQPLCVSDGMVNKLNFQHAKWSELNHAYGEASDVPELIEALTTDDAHKFEEALNELLSNIWHQGTIYDATVKALPLLLDLFKNGSVKAIDDLALLIILIASGKGYHQVHSSSLRINPFTHEPVEVPCDLEDKLSKENSVVNQTRAIIEPYLNLLVPYLAHEDGELRRVTAQAMCCYPLHKSEYLALLRTALQKENNEDVIPYIKDSIDFLSTNT